MELLKIVARDYKTWVVGVGALSYGVYLLTQGNFDAGFASLIAGVGLLTHKTETK